MVRQLVTFTLDDGRFALDAAAVRRVVRVVAITPLPDAPGQVSGVIDLHGQVVPVFDLRARFGLPAKAVELSDQLVIATAASRTVALLVDSVDDVIAVPEDRVSPAEEVLPGLDHVEGVVRGGDGMTFIHDLGTILSLDDEAALTQALDTAAADDA